MKGKILVLSTFLWAGCSLSGQSEEIFSNSTRVESNGVKKGGKIVKTDEEWKELLTPEQYHIAREKGTERAFTGKFYNHKEQGMYQCVACGQNLFSSDKKYDSGTGWPSYWAPVDENNIKTEDDSSFGMRRTEVMCSRCDSHLGHIFEDGPKPTGLRYCINSAALKFESK